MKDRLRKLLKLARSGEGGESINAQKMLEDLLVKYDIDISEIDDEPYQEVWFKYKQGKFHKQLMCHVIFLVIGDDRSVYSNSKYKKYQLGAEVNKSEAVEIELLYNSYSKELDKELETIFTAFICKNRIFQERTQKEEDFSKEEGLTQEEIDKIAHAMSGMKKTNIRKELK